MPRTERRVVFGRGEVMVTLVPRIWLINVDFPTLGRPTTATKPERTTPASLPGAGSASSAVVTTTHS